MKKFAFLFLSLRLFAQGPADGQYRPGFHFTPQAHWMNDPNGLVYANGAYQMFYQYFPGGNLWGPMHWGHASSTDLVHWKDWPVALYPDANGWIFSGSAVIDKDNTAGFGKGAMVAIFTYHNDELWKSGQKNTESQGIAYSTDGGISWTKYDRNPVLNNSGEPDFRDPKVFWHAPLKRWTMVLAAGDRIKIFTSPDLKNWTFQSDFKPTENLKPGVWECPDLFPMKDGKKQVWVMIVSHGDKAPAGGSGTRYFTGSFDGEKFVNDGASHWLDNGADFYAATTYGNTPGGERILQGWMSNWRYADKVPTQTWRGAMAFPRELSLGKDAKGYFIKQVPVKELSKSETPVWTSKEDALPLRQDGLPLDSADLSFDLDDQDVTVELANELGEQFVIELKYGTLTLNREHSGNIGFSDAFGWPPQTMDVGAIRNWRLILDKTSVEIFLNDGRYVMTNIFFPSGPCSILKISAGDSKTVRNLTLSKIGNAH